MIWGGKPLFLETPTSLSFTSSDSFHKKTPPDLSTTFRITSRLFRGLGNFPPSNQLSEAGKVAQLKGVAVIIQLVGSPSADLFCWLVVIHYVN